LLQSVVVAVVVVVAPADCCWLLHFILNRRLMLPFLSLLLAVAALLPSVDGCHVCHRRLIVAAFFVTAEPVVATTG